MEAAIIIVFTLFGCISIWRQSVASYRDGEVHASGRRVKSIYATPEQRARKRRQYYRRNDPMNPMANWDWEDFDEYDKIKAIKKQSLEQKKEAKAGIKEVERLIKSTNDPDEIANWKETLALGHDALDHVESNIKLADDRLNEMTKRY